VSTWPEVDGIEQIVVEMDLGDALVDDHKSEVLALLRQAPESSTYLDVRFEHQALPSGQLGYIVPRTRIFFNVGRCKEFWGDAMVALAVFSMTHSTPAAFFAATARKLYDNLTLLSAEEAEVVHVLVALSGGRPYSTPVAESRLQAAYVDATVSLDELLDSLEKKDVIEKRRGGQLLLTL